MYFSYWMKMLLCFYGKILVTTAAILLRMFHYLFIFYSLHVSSMPRSMIRVLRKRCKVWIHFVFDKSICYMHPNVNVSWKIHLKASATCKWKVTALLMWPCLLFKCWPQSPFSLWWDRMRRDWRCQINGSESTHLRRGEDVRVIILLIVCVWLQRNVRCHTVFAKWSVMFRCLCFVVDMVFWVVVQVSMIFIYSLYKWYIYCFLLHLLLQLIFFILL